MGRSTDKETGVERAEEVSELDGRAEARDRAGGAARRPLGEGGLSRASDLGHALLLLARQAARGGPRRVGGGGGPGRGAGAAPQAPRAGAGAGAGDPRARDGGGRRGGLG